MSDDVSRGNPDPYHAAPVPGQQPLTSRKAIVSLILGLLSFATCCFTGIPAIVVGALGLADINRRSGQIKGSGLAIAGIVTGSIGTVLVVLLPTLLLPFLQPWRQAAQRHLSMSNLHNVGLAMLQSRQANGGAYPAPYSKDAGGRPLLSWRVAMLPYVEEGALAQQFHPDEPWDSANNKPLVDRRPKFFMSPGDETIGGSATNILGVVGPNTVLTTDRPVGFLDIADGASNTIMAVELAGAGIAWSEPRDITIDELLAAMRRKPNEPGLRPIYLSGVVCVFADGHVGMIPTDIDPATLRGLCTRSGGEDAHLPGSAD